MNRLAAAAVLCACAVLASSCHGAPASRPAPPATATVHPSGTASPGATNHSGATMVVIAAGRPTARVPQPRHPDAAALRLDVRSVDNPTAQGLAIAVTVEDTADPSRRAAIGNVSPYPAGQAGTFTLVLPPAAADLIRAGPTTLVLTLSAAQVESPLQPGVSVTAEVALGGL